MKRVRGTDIRGYGPPARVHLRKREQSSDLSSGFGGIYRWRLQPITAVLSLFACLSLSGLKQFWRSG